MTVPEFHTGVADKLGYTCRLLRKAWRAGNRVVVTGDPAQLSRLDALLWTFEVGEFVPHARLRAGEVIAPRLARTPIWLVDVVDDVVNDAGRCDVLVNLGPDWVPGHAACARLIEIVADTPDELQAGRQRWRQYLAAGLTPVNRSQA